MKKKILSLLLVVSLMMAFTITSFALNNGGNIIVRKGTFQFITIEPDSFEAGESLYIDLTIKSDKSKLYNFVVRDLTTGETVCSLYCPKGDLIDQNLVDNLKS